MEAVDIYELDREAAVEKEEMDDGCGTKVRRGVGEPRFPTSRRRKSVWLAPWCSSGAGLAARRFWPVAEYASSICSLLSDEVSSISMSSTLSS